MEEIHRELLKKRQKYLMDNVIMENGILNRLKEKGIFTNNMVQAIQAETDEEKQLIRMLDMIPKRGPGAYSILMECLEADYPWVVKNFREKEQELLNAQANSDVHPDMRRTVKEYIKELARTTRLNIAQQKAIEDFLCRHITIDTNLNNAKLHGNRFYSIYRLLLSAIPVSTLDESDQMDLKDLLPENISLDKIEKEAKHVVDRVHELEATIDNCYEKLGEHSKDKDLPDLVFLMRKMLLEKEIKNEEIKNQLMNYTRQVRLAKDKAKKTQEAIEKSVEEKKELSQALETLKSKIQKLSEERQRMGMKMAFEGVTNTAPPSPRTRSSK